MRRLIINGDPDVRKGGVIDLDGEELVCFGISRQGEWHGPDRPQLWCTVGTEDETEAFERREFIPMHLDVETVDAESVEVRKRKGELTI
ncbi:HAH_0734 family protein [Halococcus sediminicola]|uniref:HAH_0734 family protein n=1 Tax=Halococcus sediminicola TaxID=1264579 RepID=UPI000679E6EB|nr:HAH_0734 family protein [Halococcus sediminicola]